MLLPFLFWPALSSTVKTFCVPLRWKLTVSPDHTATRHLSAPLCPMPAGLPVDGAFRTAVSDETVRTGLDQAPRSSPQAPAI